VHLSFSRDVNGACNSWYVKVACCSSYLPTCCWKWSLEAHYKTNISDHNNRLRFSHSNQ